VGEERNRGRRSGTLRTWSGVLYVPTGLLIYIFRLTTEAFPNVGKEL
jgi:hypothetical protein